MIEWTLDELLPHRPPMVLLDEVESFDAAERRLVARVSIGEGQMFLSDGAVPNWVAVEYMAQAAAALAGCWDRTIRPGCPPRPGLLLGTRRLTLGVDAFPVGGTYFVTAINEFSDDEAASFSCSMADDSGRVVASAVLNAYRPPDFGRFLKEQGIS